MGKALSTLPSAPPPVSRTIGVVSVYRGVPPAPKARRGRSCHEHYRKAAIELKPKEWLIWRDAPKTFPSAQKTVEKWAAEAGVSIVVYRTKEGQTIISCPDADGFLEPDDASGNPNPRGR